MKKLNFGKIVGEDGLDYTIKGCVDCIDNLPHTPQVATRYYVGNDVPRNVLCYDGATWVNEGAKTYPKVTDSRRLDVYNMAFDINENMTYSDGFMSGYLWGKTLELGNVENRGEPIKLFGNFKYKVKYTDREDNYFIGDFNAITEPGQDSGRKTKRKYMTGTNHISYAISSGAPEAVLLVMFDNKDLDLNPNNYNEAMMFFIITGIDASRLVEIKIISANLTIIYAK